MTMEELLKALRAEPRPSAGNMKGVSFSEFCERTVLSNIDNVQTVLARSDDLALCYPVQLVGLEHALADWLKANFNIEVTVNAQH